MINITIQAFGIVKDFIGQQPVTWEVEKDMTVGELRQLVRSKCLVHPSLPIAIVRHNQYQKDDECLQSGDDIFLMPPVSGG